jgi:hypothetical protein
MHADYERRYFRTGGVAHLVPIGSEISLCNRWSGWEHRWLGTGSQDEIDRARELTMCRRCEQAFVTIAALNYGKGQR